MLCLTQPTAKKVDTRCAGVYLQIMVDIGDIAREEVSKGLGEDWSSAVSMLYGPGQHGIIGTVYAGLGHKSTGNQTFIFISRF